MTENTKQKYRRIDYLFLIYTLLAPLLGYLFFLLNGKYGVRCADGCLGDSKFIFYVCQTAFVALIAGNIFLYIRCIKYIPNKTSLQLMLICNCILLASFSVLSINAWFYLLVGIPFTCVKYVTGYLWCYILFKNIFQMKTTIAVVMALLVFGIVATTEIYLAKRDRENLRNYVQQALSERSMTSEVGAETYQY